MDENFKALLNRLSSGFASRDAFAKALGINSSRLSRAMNTGDFPFNVSNCLRLAKISGESPTAILRAAGKGDVADLIEALYGKDRTRLLTPSERELLDAWHRMSPRAQEALQSIIDDLAGPKTRQRRKAS